MRYFVIAVFLLIVASLGSALYFVYHDKSSSRRAMTALAIRVALSIALFIFLMAGFYFGFIPGRLR
jgi:membrane protein YdbS with pleckstrin-like domain